MTHEMFRDKSLGWWSSHPYWQMRRRLVFTVVAMVFIGIAVAFVVLTAADYHNWVLFYHTWEAWPTVVIALVAALLASFMTMSLGAKWAYLQATCRIAGDAGAERRPAHIGPVALVMSLAVLLALVPLVIRWIPGIPLSVQFAFNVLPALPLVALLLGLRVLSSGQQPGSLVKRRPIWLLLLILVGALAAMTLVHDIAAAFNRSDLSDFLASWLPWCAALQGPFVGSLTLVFLAFILFAMWGLWFTVIPAPTLKADQAQPGTKESFWTRLRAYVWRLLCKGEPVGTPPPMEEKAPNWLSELLANLPEGCRPTTVPGRPTSSETSPLLPENDSEADVLRAVFGGLTPTEDQAKLFRHFISAYQEALEAKEPKEPGETEQEQITPSADLLVEGDPGSGKTAALIACAVYAAFVRGQRVLFVVPDALRERIVKDRIQTFLRKTGLDYYLRVGVIGKNSVATWVQQKGGETAVSDGGILPHVLISTPDALEEHVYGSMFHAGEEGSRLNCLAHLLEVLLIDDFVDFDDARRSHLPFVIDKQRLLLAAECIPLQVVVTCPKLAEVAHMILGPRLFTDNRFKAHSIHRLLPLPSGKAWQAELQATDVPAATDHIVAWCLRKGLHVVLLRRGVDERERARQQQEFARIGGKGTVTVLSHIDQPVPHALRVDAIIHQTATRGDTCPALRVRMGHEETVVLTLAPEGEVREELGEGIVPMVADRSAMPLLVTHLKSAVRFLRDHTPVAKDVWCEFGVPLQDMPRAQPEGTPDVTFDYDEWVDPREPHYGALLWPWSTLRNALESWESVNVHVLPSQSEEVYRSPRGFEWFIGQRAIGHGKRAAIGRALPQESASQIALWRTRAGADLATVDLVRLKEMRLVISGAGQDADAFIPEEIRQTARGIELVAKRYQGNGDDAYLPIYDIRWDSPRSQMAMKQGGGVDHGLAWYNCESPDDSAANVTTTLLALMTEYAVVTEMDPVRFAYPAHGFAVVLAPKRLESLNIKEVVGTALSGHWETGTETGFWPELTSAMNYAFLARVPGLSYFARVLAFRLSGKAESVGHAVVFLLEPRSGGRTIAPVMNRILEDRQERRNLFKSVGWFLEQLRQSHMPQQQFVRRFARIGYVGDTAIRHIDEAAELVRLVLEREQVQARMAEELLPIARRRSDGT